MNVTTTITHCYHNCPMFRVSMDGMECGHPYWKGKDAYANMISAYDNIKSDVPRKCPLRIAALTTTIRVPTLKRNAQ